MLTDGSSYCGPSLIERAFVVYVHISNGYLDLLGTFHELRYKADSATRLLNNMVCMFHFLGRRENENKLQDV